MGVFGHFRSRNQTHPQNPLFLTLFWAKTVFSAPKHGCFWLHPTPPTPPSPPSPPGGGDRRVRNASIFAKPRGQKRPVLSYKNEKGGGGTLFWVSRLPPRPPPPPLPPPPSTRGGGWFHSRQRFWCRRDGVWHIPRRLQTGAVYARRGPATIFTFMHSWSRAKHGTVVSAVCSAESGSEAH